MVTHSPKILTSEDNATAIKLLLTTMTTVTPQHMGRVTKNKLADPETIQAILALPRERNTHRYCSLMISIFHIKVSRAIDIPHRFLAEKCRRG